MNKQEIEKALSWVKEVINHQVFERATYEDTYGTGDLSEEERKEVYEEMDNRINLFKTIQCALTQQLNNGWIPVSERLPEEYGTYMVAWRPINMTETDVKAKTRSQITHFYEILAYDPEDGAGWLETIEQSEGAYKILAWQPLPEPYKELATDNNVVTKSGKDNNALTFGDKIRESNESLPEFLSKKFVVCQDCDH